MKIIYNHPRLKPRRKILRYNQTIAENTLWMKLRSRQILGNKFYRQYSIGPYITDFYCPKKRLVIEIDGSGHTGEENQIYDRERTEYFVSQDIKVMRFWNNEVTGNIEGVLERIVEEL